MDNDKNSIETFAGLGCGIALCLVALFIRFLGNGELNEIASFIIKCAGVLSVVEIISMFEAMSKSKIHEIITEPLWVLVLIFGLIYVYTFISSSIICLVISSLCYYVGLTKEGVFFFKAAIVCFVLAVWARDHSSE